MEIINRLAALSAAQPWFALFWAVAGALPSLWIGHYFVLWRHRRLGRQRFNELATPIRAELLIELSEIHTSRKYPERASIHALAFILGDQERRDFYRALAAYKHARQQHTNLNAFGQPCYSRTDHIEQAIEDLLTQLKRR